ncbi:ImmA/IrrE family metallo-endopeptidase [Lentzea sp. CA-135723]|uniref:ImmA/IrrE family metallo-endopeptidase n=1 Tax=Lentzea sp. CA-135723 TaxID=3239950 RepID=UPI003D915D26
MTDSPVTFAPDYAFPPGDTLRSKLSELGMAQTDLADRLGMSEKHVSHMMKGNAPLTYETAVALERITGVPASTWNGLESHYRDHLLRERLSVVGLEEAEWLSLLPLATLRERGYISDATPNGRTLGEVLRFFAVADIKAWKKVWSQPIASFRRSGAHHVNAEATATWLRIGEIKAHELACNPFDASAVRKILPALRELTRSKDFIQQLVQLCATVGIAIVLEPEVSGSRVHGASRWLTPRKALIQLSDRQKKEDVFWFSLFHEIGHLLLHSKKASYIHDGSEDSFTEDEANKFARDLLIPPKWLDRLTNTQSHADIHLMANEIGVSASIVAGRLARDGIGGWTWPKVSKLRNSLHLSEN